MNNHNELDMLQKFHQSAMNIHIITNTYPGKVTFGLTQQLRRYSISALSNHSEGIRRLRPKQTPHFLEMARGLLFKSQLNETEYKSLTANY